VILGVLDWGVGGLFALRHAVTLEPDLDVLYLSDSGATPYGLQSRAQLNRSVGVALGRLADSGATHLLVACHSASTVLGDLRGVAVPVIGMIDGGCVAADATDVAVIGGARTVRSGAWRAALLASGRRVRQRIAQPLSAHVEAGRSSDPRCLHDLHSILRPVADAGTLVLACTHYQALVPAIQQIMPNAQLVDPAYAAVQSLPLRPGRGHRQFFTTGSPQILSAFARSGLGWDVGDVARWA
jgi:glutamate racemase